MNGDRNYVHPYNAILLKKKKNELLIHKTECTNVKEY